ncbi:MAG: GTPase Era [Gemmatimonadetes bacterium]|nr:GTPase Era [Gemmatimonadota bacterium]NIO30890.1 GTPase Era [Gemmatimonadota bacterium]
MDSNLDQEARARFRCGYVALAGRPNVGKSTLLNALVGEHLSIVSSKAQTTRERVSGILTTEDYQVLFIDAPGLIEPRYELQEAMRWAAGAALDEADVVAFIVDGTKPDTIPDAESSDLIGLRSVPTIVAINKRDLLDAASEARLIEEVEVRGWNAISVSAKTGEGLDDLLGYVVPLLPESPALFPEDDSATQSLRFFAEEYVRETCMETYREEIPYSVMCRVDEFREERDPVFIRIVIYVEKESQKGIIIGRGGSAIKKIGELSRRKIENLIGRQVYLELRVKVLAGWRRKRASLRQLGFALPPPSKGGHNSNQG